MKPLVRATGIDIGATLNQVASDQAGGLVRAVLPSRFSLCRIAGIFADAFSDYPLLRWALTNRSSRARLGFQLFSLLISEFGSRSDAIYRAGHDYGAAIWMRSDRLSQPNEEECGQINQKLQEMLGTRSTKRLLAINRAMEKYHPSTSHLYLYLIGVRRHRQRYGLGSQLMLTGLKTADISRLPVFLETSSEDLIRFYRKFNFEVVDKYVVARGSPPTWTMIRIPRKEASVK